MTVFVDNVPINTDFDKSNCRTILISANKSCTAYETKINMRQNLVANIQLDL